MTEFVVLLNRLKSNILRSFYLLIFIPIISGCNEPMKAYDVKKEIKTYQTCLPKPLHIEEIGWEAFLNRWNEEGLFFVKKTIFRFGADPYYHYTKNEWIKYIQSIGLSEKYLVLKHGGITYPPETLKDKKRAEEWRKMYVDYLRHKLNSQIELNVIHESIFNRPQSFTSEDGIFIRNSLMFPPANDVDIQQKEKELGINLPDSYKNFLKVSNGWTLFDVMFSPVEEISWAFSKENLYWETLLEEMTMGLPEPRISPGDPIPPSKRKLLSDKDYEEYEILRGSILISQPLDVTLEQYFTPYKLTHDGDWLGFLGLYNATEGEDNYLSGLIPFSEMMEHYYRRDIAKRCAMFEEFNENSKIHKHNS